MAKSFSVGIVDNDERSLHSLREILTDLIDELSVKWMVTSGEDAEPLCLESKSRPDMLLVDMSLNGMQGPVLCRRIREKIDVMPILAMTAFPVERYAIKAANSGAQGICSKNSEADLVNCVNTINCAGVLGAGFDTVRHAHERLVEERQRNAKSLTFKEMEVMDYASEGMLDEEVAHKMNIAVSTVRKHMQNAKNKLGAKNRFQALWMWINGED
ncbi:response regulator transcription factor [Bifidobacterium callitrichos]|uniref:Response regulator transcription factor n=1 Tax=Bifidobacterium callitrichos TaxID=762209 RepID=A0A5M9ZA94_9BIFI|nr:response regulator transcription factor [Bifidobacterium callitrichos]KAA8815438.1 response regulator transcription factor [Bifidobacterium callitrichos]